MHDAGSFQGSNASLGDILALIDRLLIRRSSGTGPSIFICLGHQLAAASHVRLIRRAAMEVLALTRLPLDPQGHALASLQRLCRRVVAVRESLQVIKAGTVIATGWNDRCFAVARNEMCEVGTRRLLPYARRGNGNHVPEELHVAHAVIADELDGVIDIVMRIEREHRVEMSTATR